MPESENKSFGKQAVDFLPRILIVERDDDTRLMLKYLLELWKYQVVEAVSNEEAAGLTKTFRPALILMNIESGNGTSLTSSRRIRELRAFDGATIILISTPVEPEVRTSALAVADDFLVKPIDFGYLEKILEKYLRKVSKPTEASV